MYRLCLIKLFHSRPFLLVIVRKAQVLPIRLTTALLYSSIPVSLGCVKIDKVIKTCVGVQGIIRSLAKSAIYSRHNTEPQIAPSLCECVWMAWLTMAWLTIPPKLYTWVPPPVSQNWRRLLDGLTILEARRLKWLRTVTDLTVCVNDPFWWAVGTLHGSHCHQCVNG